MIYGFQLTVESCQMDSLALTRNHQPSASSFFPNKSSRKISPNSRPKLGSFVNDLYFVVKDISIGNTNDILLFAFATFVTLMMVDKIFGV